MPKPASTASASLPYQLRSDKEHRMLALVFPNLEGQPYTLLTYKQASSLAHAILRNLSEEMPVEVAETEINKIIRSLEDILIELRSLYAAKKGDESHES